MPKGKIPREMFDPYNLLDERELPTMSAETAIRQIRELADKILPHASSDYYVQKIKAIAILAEIAAERLGKE